jgi:death-on-curing protein
MEIEFLSLEDVLFIHEFQLKKYGGGSGIRDEGLLTSAIEMAASGFGDEYFHSFPFEMAAAYLFHMVQNHPFIDGNKRTGFASAHTFLKFNGYELNFSEDEVYTLVIEVATGQLSKEDVAKKFSVQSLKI